MSDAEKANRRRNREIARNEANRQATSAMRVSTWAILVAVVIGAVVAALVWVSLRR